MRNKRSMVFSIVIINISLIAVHLALFGIISSVYGKRTMEGRINLASEIFASADMNFANEMHRLDTLMTLCVNDTAFILSLSNRMDYNFFLNQAMEASTKLSIIKNSLPYAQNVFAYSSEADRVILHNGSVFSAETFFQRILPLDRYQELGDGVHKSGQTALYVCGLNDYGYIAVEIDLSAFAYINQNMDPDCFFYVLDREGMPFMESGDLSLTEEQLQEARRSGKIFLDGTEYACVSRRLQRSGYQGILLIDNKPFMMPVHYFWVVCIVSLAVLVISSLLFLYLNLRVYLPLKNFTTSFGGGKNENEVSFIENKIHDLLYEIYTLSERNTAPQAALPEKIALHYLIYGGRQLNEVHLEPLRKKYDFYHVLVLALQMDQGQPAPQLMVSIERGLSEKFGIQLISIDKYLSAIITKDPTDALLEELEALISSQEGARGYAGVREHCTDLVGLNTEYRLALDHLRASRIDFDRKLVTDREAAIPAHYELSMSLQNSLYEYISSGLTEPFLTLLHSLFYQPEITLQGFVDLYIHSINLIRQAMLSQNGTCQMEFVEENLYNTTYIYHLLEGYLKKMSPLPLADQTDMKDRILLYLKEHLSEELSLDSVADRFELSPTYLSSWFKKKTGINFLSYISTLRMEKAIRLLKEERNIKVYELAKLVGIDNVATFIRQFKKHTGMTPEQYRRHFLSSSLQDEPPGGMKD